MSQKKTKDKNLELEKSDVQVASRLTYYTPQLTDKSTIQDTNKKQSSQNNELRPPLHASVDELKDVASIIDYSMFFMNQNSEAVKFEEDKKIPVEEDDRNSLKNTETTLEETSFIPPSLLARVEENEMNQVAEKVTEIVAETTIGSSIDNSTDLGQNQSTAIQPSLLARVAQSDISVSELSRLSESLNPQNFTTVSEENSIIRPSLLESMSDDNNQNSQKMNEKLIESGTQSNSVIRPSLLASMEEGKQESSDNHTSSYELQQGEEKVETDKLTSIESGEKNIEKSQDSKLKVNTTSSLGLLSMSKLSHKNVAKLDSQSNQKIADQNSLDTDTKKIETHKAVPKVTVSTPHKKITLNTAQNKVTKDKTKILKKASNLALNLDAHDTVFLEGQNGLQLTPTTNSKTLEPSKSTENLVNSEAIKKSTYTSVLDRLTDGDSSAVNIFGDGTSLPVTLEEEKSIFSSAFAEEKETDVVKVAFFQKKAKTNLTTADLATLPYFQEDKEFMSKVDEAWYDQGEKSSKNLVFVFSGLLLFFITWAAFASIDEVARGQGQVIPSQRMQLLQHLEGGILNDILVSEGDTVEPDQILARVDNVSAASSLRDIESQITEADLALIRLEAERKGVEPVFPEKYIILVPEIVAAQEQTFLSRSLQQESSYGIFEQQIEQKHQELNEAMSRQRTYENAQALVQKRVDIAQPLVAKKLYPEVDFLNLKQELVRLDGDIDAVKNSIAKINAEVREAEGRLSLSKKEFMSEVIKEINTLRGEIATLEQGKTAGTDRVTRTELRSQVRGVVNRILLNTKGGVVKPAETIMEIVPLDDTLVIETKVRPQDIAFIHPNQKAVVRITAYDASIYGTMDGFVEQIGADTVTDEQGEIFFLIKVRTEKSAIFYNGEALPIMPGMIASVDILTGKKTVLSYLMKPITKASQYALKER